ncbi:hypothetical protein PPL_00470 [Heterostelium album PN500]|uniref:DUF885 family protein n=1 Tax=Heterostelium pallidum (strain ATCC 26659 / Pp 5 / PN500) TaxID=670386 RepID=D3AWJ5_HETP5|nr:hypothetical protein PPL_00470 [Heterostelium album PN500]EFA86668.1 hypothetical protein PPL_00470 [Heterostelium album PN500]|eukprot:XP_020438772.1 hypothetical protein PPL_00470 [Heterostelium album PN500]
MTLTRIHVLERYGISIHNSLLDDISPSFRAKSKDKIAKNIRLLHTFETKVLNDLEREDKDSFQNWISYNLMHWYLTTTLFGHNLLVYAPPLFGNIPTIYPCNSYRGAIYALYLTLHSIQSLDCEDEIYHYITRIRRTKNYVEHIIEDFELRIRKNITPPADTIIKSNQQIKEFIELPGGFVENHFIYQRVSQEIHHYHYSTRVKILNSLKKLWCLPNGEELYRFHSYFYTSTTMCPMELAEIGYRELERIQRDIIFLAKPEFTFNSTKETFGQFLNRIVFDPIFKIRSDDIGKKETLTYLNETYHETRSKIAELFENLPDLSIDFEETVVGHFEPNPFLYKPAVGDRSAVLFVNCSFYDGWGHYAEGLAVEYGWLKSKWEKLAHHIMDLRSTCRLITDCSIHFEGIQWSKENASKFLIEQGGFDLNEVDHEVNKIAVIPGWGLSQKIGQMKIVEIREYAKAQLQERFSIQKFHSIVLNNGSLPLDVLFQVVEYWINEQLEHTEKNIYNLKKQQQDRHTEHQQQQAQYPNN